MESPENIGLEARVVNGHNKGKTCTTASEKAPSYAGGLSVGEYIKLNCKHRWIEVPSRRRTFGDRRTWAQDRKFSYR